MDEGNLIINISDDESVSNSNSHESLPVDLNSNTPYSDIVKSKKTSKHVKRPLNAFMIWSQTERKNMLKLYPNAHQHEISRILGEKWKCLSWDQIKPFVEEAKKLKVLHMLEYPDYKYKPKKRSKDQSRNSNVPNRNTPEKSKVASSKSSFPFKTKSSKVQECSIKEQKQIQASSECRLSDDKSCSASTSFEDYSFQCEKYSGNVTLPKTLRAYSSLFSNDSEEDMDYLVRTIIASDEEYEKRLEEIKKQYAEAEKMHVPDDFDIPECKVPTMTELVGEDWDKLQV